MNQDNENHLECNMCDSDMSYHNFNGTHIWICDGNKDESNVGCPNVQFEYITAKDLDNLSNFLNERQRTNDSTRNSKQKEQER